jgi:outer membrane murein-binding lipoprotein Lpp
MLGRRTCPHNDAPTSSPFQVAELNAQVQALEAQFNAAVDDKNAAIAESERCQRKLQLANRLINALASEGALAAGPQPCSSRRAGRRPRPSHPNPCGRLRADGCNHLGLARRHTAMHTPNPQASAGRAPWSSSAPATTCSRATCCWPGGLFETSGLS